MKAQETGKRRLKDDWKTHSQSPQVDEEAEGAAKGYIDENDQAASYDHDDENHGGTGNNESLDNIDPQLLRLSQLMSHETSACDLAAVSDSLDMLPDLSPTTTATLVPSDPTAFIDKFSKRYDFKNEVAGDTVPVGAGKWGE
jgi:hypothetical protein